jgi:hypothetical protein
VKFRSEVVFLRDRGMVFLKKLQVRVLRQKTFENNNALPERSPT